MEGGAGRLTAAVAVAVVVVAVAAVAAGEGTDETGWVDSAPVEIGAASETESKHDLNSASLLGSACFAWPFELAAAYHKTAER